MSLGWECGLKIEGKFACEKHTGQPALKDDNKCITNSFYSCGTGKRGSKIGSNILKLCSWDEPMLWDADLKDDA